MTQTKVALNACSLMLGALEGGTGVEPTLPDGDGKRSEKGLRIG